MLQVIYRDGADELVVAEVLVNKSVTVGEALAIAGVYMDDYAAERGWEGWDPEALDLREVGGPEPVSGISVYRQGGRLYLEDSQLKVELLEDLRAGDIYWDERVGYIHEDGSPIQFREI